MISIYKKHAGWLCLMGKAAFAALLLTACENEEAYVIPKADTPELSVSKESVALDQRQANDPAVSFSWTRGSNRGTGSAIDYALQIAGNSDQLNDAYEIHLGRAIYSYQFDTKTLNALLLNQFGYAPGQSHPLSARIKTVVADTSVANEFSNAVEVSVTPYQPVTETLFLIGDAAPNGWDANNAAALTADESNPGVFSYSGALVPGEFKFITTLGEFLPSYNKGEDDETLVYRTEDDQPDEKFLIEEAGAYEIMVDLLDLSMAIDKLEQPAFSQLYIVGDGSPSGWNIDTPEAFTQSESDPFVFTYKGLLTPGSFKILAGATGDWCGEWYRPLVDGESLSSTTVEQNSGCETDNKWSVTEENQGYYKITLNTRDLAIHITQINLYMVGDAGPNGWNINNPEPMERNGSVYTYSGPLSTGEFKFSTYQGDWCDGEWINAATASQPISNTSFIYTQGCEGPDNKWIVESAGDYTISIDLANDTMTIE